MLCGIGPAACLITLCSLPPAPAAARLPLQVQRSVFEQQAKARAGSKVAQSLQQTVCPLSGLIINKEESRIQDHLQGRNYK